MTGHIIRNQMKGQNRPLWTCRAGWWWILTLAWTNIHAVDPPVKQMQIDREMLETVHLLQVGGDSLRLGDHLTGRPFVLVALSMTCPISQYYLPELEELRSEFSEEVVFAGFLPGRQPMPDSVMYARFLQTGKQFPLLLDPQGRILAVVRATITPEVFLVDEEGRVVYQGMIDDSFFRLGKKRAVVSEHHLERAIRQFLDGEAVDPDYVRSIGCYIER